MTGKEIKRKTANDELIKAIIIILTVEYGFDIDKACEATSSILKEYSKSKPTNLVEGDAEKEPITHFHVNDNSDGFRDWLRGAKINFKPNGHFTSIPIDKDIFTLGYEFALYKQKHQNKSVEKEQSEIELLKNRIEELESQNKKAIDWCDEKHFNAVSFEEAKPYGEMIQYLLSLSNINK